MYWADHTKYVAAYTTLVQSSGVGKTLLAKKVLQVEFGIYICLRKRTSSGFPPRTAHIADFLLSDSGTLSAALEQFQRNVIDELNVWLRTLAIDLHTTSPSKRQDIISQWNNHVETLEVQLRLVQQRSQQNPVLPVAIPHFFVFLDEASALMDPVRPSLSARQLFQDRRQAWKSNVFPKNMFTVLLDTHSRVSNFTPTVEADSSQRRDPTAETGDRMLFHPFYLMSTTDIMSIQADKVLKSIQHPVARDLAGLFSLGRPLWFGSLNWDPNLFGPNPFVELLSLVDFAASKLRFCSSADKCAPAPITLLPLVGCRVALNISPCSHLAQELVAEHMAMCTHVSEDRKTLMVRYVSEPVLAEASAWSTKTDAIRAEVVKALFTSINVGEVNVGYLGELVAQLLLVFARDCMSYCKQTNAAQLSRSGENNLHLDSHENVGAQITLTSAAPLDPPAPESMHQSLVPTPAFAAFSDEEISRNFVSTECPLSSFLKVFCQADDSLVIDRFPAGSSVLVRLTHFVPITYSPSSQNELEVAYKRAAGMVCKPGQWGIDLVVPIKVIGSDKSVKFSCLLVQVKNVVHVTGSMQDEFVTKLALAYALPELNTDEFVSNTCLVLLMNLGDTVTAGSRRPVTPLSARTRSSGVAPIVGLIMSGLNATVFPFLHDMPLTLAALQTLLDKGLDPAKLCKDAEVERVKTSFPVMYRSVSKQAKKKSKKTSEGAASAE